MNTVSVVTAARPSPTKLGSNASRWCELQGSGSWEGLLDPLDIDLRASLIHYGELAEAAYDGYNSDTHSPDAGWCLYSEAELLAASGVSHPEHYTVTKFVYATCGFWLPPATSRTAPVPPVTDQFFAQPPPPHRPMEGFEREHVSWWRESNWIGYVAVATDDGVAALGRRDIVVAWRGTVERLEWANNANAWFTTAAPVLGSAARNYPDAKLHRGFLSVYSAKDRRTTYNKTTSARDQVREEVRRLMEEHKDEVTSITVTGHSLGASLATLNAVDMVAHGVNVPPGCSEQQACPVTALLFASPRVGNDEFRRAFSSFPKLRALHVKNEEDKVPKVPPPQLWYADAATATLPINTDRSPYLRPGNMLTRHNLECYLHGVAGDHGEGKFWLVLDRDLALVNKSTDALKDIYHIPANWWGNKEYHMIKGGDGRWRLEDSKEDKLR